MKRSGVFLGLVFVMIYQVQARVNLPKVFSDNMVIQRGKPINVWGWADKGEALTVTLNGQSVRARADKTGRWSVALKPMGFGGPYVMNVAGNSNTITIKNILIGDVWVCSGQSNMEWIVKNTAHAQEEMAGADYPNIRLFTVEKAMSYKPQPDLAGGQWLTCSPATVANFSAVAYFFGRKLHQDTQVPIGLINTSWGGTNIQTWVSWEVMSKTETYKDITPKKLDELSAGKVAYSDYLQSLKNDKGLAERWYESSGAPATWDEISLPARWEGSAIGDTDGIIWFRKEFQVDKAALSKKATLRLGMIDDEDITYINGRIVGEEDEWNKERHYDLPDGLLVEGTNTITVRIRDNQGPGGMFSDAAHLCLDFGDSKIPLAGQWTYKASATTKGFGMQHSGPNEFPSQLFNAMVAPLTPFAIKGAIWYQGEANTSEAQRYRTLFPDMINDWREHWNDAFPFYWVQLANFMSPSPHPSESQWAELREAQSFALHVPNTGQAVIIDIGEAGDIHPRNKKDVGHRLALIALKHTYGRDVVCSGPRYQSSKIEQGKIIVTFTEVGSGLKAMDKYGYLKGFAIAGSDRKFVWAKAYIDGHHVVVYSDEVKAPVAVRYAWADNPDDANLYSHENLPASPFRTDF